VPSLKDQMHYVRGHAHKDGVLVQRSTRGRSYHRRNPRRFSVAYVSVAATAFLLLLWLIFEH